MHSKGLYHRDIKPENIFLAQDGSMKLGDFGLSTTESWTEEASVGSDRYMAPEQFDPADAGYCPAQADIWAIGICLLNILFSRNPFVTPSDSDVLFTDFVHDRQSLFDIFPSMSQDTFEVLNHALTIDPTKRSITAMRAALERALIFTTDDDLLDEFCIEDREVVPASANRQPLRTPSIQSPPIEQGGAFPWAKALEMSPQNGRQLSVIADLEDDLYPEKTPSLYTPSGLTPSMYSVIDSALGASIKSLTLREPKPKNAAKSNLTPVTGSLPVSASKPINAMSTVFGKKDNMVSKSWSDLWDEEEEEELEDARRRFNERNLSTESIDEDLTIGRTGLSEIKNTAVTNARIPSPLHDDLGVFGPASSSEDVNSFEKVTESSYKYPLYSPPAKRSMFDKWAALGNRRRAAGSDTEETKPPVNRKRTNTESKRRGFGFRNFAGNVGFGSSTNNENASIGHGMGIVASGRNRKDKDRASKTKEIPGNKHQDGVKILDWRRDNHDGSVRSRRYSNYYSAKTIEDDEFNDGDVEWVGGWNDLHL